MLACCGLIEINLIVSNYASTFTWTLYSVIIIGVFLGIVQFRIGSDPLERVQLSTGVLLSFLIINTVYIVFASQLPIPEMINILTTGLLFPVLCFEESTRFLLFYVRQTSEVEATSSPWIPVSIEDPLLLGRIEARKWLEIVKFTCTIRFVTTVNRDWRRVLYYLWLSIHQAVSFRLLLLFLFNHLGIG